MNETTTGGREIKRLVHKDKGTQPVPCRHGERDSRWTPNRPTTSSQTTKKVIRSAGKTHEIGVVKKHSGDYKRKKPRPKCGRKCPYNASRRGAKTTEAATVIGGRNQGLQNTDRISKKNAEGVGSPSISPTVNIDQKTIDIRRGTSGENPAARKVRMKAKSQQKAEENMKKSSQTTPEMRKKGRVEMGWLGYGRVLKLRKTSGGW